MAPKRIALGRRLLGITPKTEQLTENFMMFRKDAVTGGGWEPGCPTQGLLPWENSAWERHPGQAPAVRVEGSHSRALRLPSWASSCLSGVKQFPGMEGRDTTGTQQGQEGVVREAKGAVQSCLPQCLEKT